MLDDQLCQVGGWFFNSYFGEKSKTNNLIILSYQKIIMHLHFWRLVA